MRIRYGRAAWSAVRLLSPIRTAGTGGCGLALQQQSIPAVAMLLSSVRMSVNMPTQVANMPAQATGQRFSDLSISPYTIKAVSEVMKYEYLTPVQEQTLPIALEGHDVIAKAKTGTGKTVGFLLPAIERVAKAQAEGGARSSILALIISPTRELAQQIRAECETLLTFHKKMSSLAVVGGTNVNSDVKKLSGAVPPTFLIATPGRLIDLLQNHGAADLLADVRVLVLDEADRLLDMGFRRELLAVLSAIEATRATRQTLLFSATLEGDVMKVARIATRSVPRLVDTVGEEEQTHTRVPQRVVVTPLRQLPAELLSLVRELRATRNHKLIAFFPTAKTTQLYAELFARLGISVLEMHSRKSQSQRTRVAEQFRKGTGLIMFSSDVSARGMDYPDVTHVVQVGMASDRATYIHRLGRTARAGKEGGGVLLLADFEQQFLNTLDDLPIRKKDAISAEERRPLDAELSDAFSKLPEELRGGAYQAWLGFYNSQRKTTNLAPESLVALANSLATDVMRLPSPPALEAKIIGKMGLKGVKGLVKASGVVRPPRAPRAGGGAESSAPARSVAAHARPTGAAQPRSGDERPAATGRASARGRAQAGSGRGQAGRARAQAGRGRGQAGAGRGQAAAGRTSVRARDDRGF